MTKRPKDKQTLMQKDKKTYKQKYLNIKRPKEK